MTERWHDQGTTRIGSLFSGIGGLDLATEAVFGGEVVWQSENDPYASHVLQRWWPDVPNLGDIKTVQHFPAAEAGMSGSETSALIGKVIPAPHGAKRLLCGRTESVDVAETESGEAVRPGSARHGHGWDCPGQSCAALFGWVHQIALP